MLICHHQNDPACADDGSSPEGGSGDEDAQADSGSHVHDESISGEQQHGRSKSKQREQQDEEEEEEESPEPGADKHSARARKEGASTVAAKGSHVATRKEDSMQARTPAAAAEADVQLQTLQPHLQADDGGVDHADQTSAKSAPSDFAGLYYLTGAAVPRCASSGAYIIFWSVHTMAVWGTTAVGIGMACVHAHHLP